MTLTRHNATITPLTSLRFVAALMVFAYHAPVWQAWVATHTLGQVGVGFFFVLSGFILTHTYAERFDLRTFAIARFARIYPAYVVATAIALVVIAWFGSETWSAATTSTRIAATIAQLLTVQAFIPDKQIYFGINSPAWSVSVEAFFYSLFPLLRPSLRRSFANASSATILGAALLTWGTVTAIVLFANRPGIWSGYVFPPVRLVDFVVGMLLALAFRRGYALRGSATAWELGAIGAIIAAILVSPSMPIALRFSLWLLPFWAALIAIVALRRGRVSRVLSHAALVRLGEMSYAFYLLHLTVLIVAEHLSANVSLVSALGFVVTLSGAWLLNIGVEQPMRRVIRGLGEHRDHGLQRATPPTETPA